MSTFTDTYGIGHLRSLFTAVAAADRETILAAMNAAAAAPAATEVLYFLAGRSLWNVAGGQYPTFEARAQLVRDLEAPGSLWAGVFPIGDLELVVNALCGDPVDVDRVSDDHLTIAFIAVAAHQLPRRTDVWPTWEQHFDQLVADFAREHATHPQP